MMVNWSYSKIRVLVLLSLCLLPSIVVADKPDDAKQAKKRWVLGWEEKVEVESDEGEDSLVLHAKLDTGHSGSSIYARDVKRFKRKKESWVKFSIQDRYGHDRKFERKILRRTTLKSSGNRIRTEYVVELGLCLGGQYFEDEIALSNREGFSQELRLGRQSLEGHFVVDPALTYTTKPKCKKNSKKKK